MALTEKAVEWIEARGLDVELAVRLGIETSRLPGGGKRLPVVLGSGGCWLWSGHIRKDGYGATWIGSRPYAPHRLMYSVAFGDPPEGTVLDHLCRVRNCCNPGHLEAVSSAENLRRGVGWAGRKSQQTHCVNGHELGGDNLYITPAGNRQCRTCRKERQAKFRANRPGYSAASQRDYRRRQRNA